MTALESGWAKSEENADQFRHAIPDCHGKIVVDGGEQVCTTCAASAKAEEAPEVTATSPSKTALNPRYYFSLGSAAPSGITTSRVRYQSLRAVREASLDDVIEKVGTSLSLPSGTRITAAKIGRSILKMRSSQRTSVVFVSVFSIVQACRMTGTPRTLLEVVHASSRFSNFSAARVFHEFNRIAGSSALSYKNASPDEYIRLIMRRLSATYHDPVYLRAVFRRACDVSLSIRTSWYGKNPLRVAAYCVHSADVELGYKIGAERLCSVTDLNPEVLKNYRDRMDPQEASAPSDPANVSSSQINDAEFLFEEARSFKVSLRRSAQ